jgi:hypothetical protein
MNQQAKDRLSHLLARTPEDRRPKAKVEAKDKEGALDTTTKSFLTGRKQECLPGNCTKKRERFPTTVVGYEENEVRDLLALERPKKKNKKQVYSKVLCFNCKKTGHYANKCPEKNDEADIQDSGKMDLNHVTCFKCKQKGHYSNRCPEKSTSMTVVNGEDQRSSKFKEKTQSGVANWKRVFLATSCNRF